MSRKKITDLVDFSGFSSRLKKIRGNFTQAEFGRLLGVRDATISRYESGRIPDVVTLKKIAALGGVTVEWLLNGGGRPAAEIQEHAPEIYDARPLPPLAFPLLVEVVAAADAYLARRRLKRSILQRARLYVLLYEHCAENKERPDDVLIEKYLVLAD